MNQLATSSIHYGGVWSLLWGCFQSLIWQPGTSVTWAGRDMGTEAYWSPVKKPKMIAGALLWFQTSFHQRKRNLWWRTSVVRSEERSTSLTTGMGWVIFVRRTDSSNPCTLWYHCPFPSPRPVPSEHEGCFPKFHTQWNSSIPEMRASPLIILRHFNCRSGLSNREVALYSSRGTILNVKRTLEKLSLLLNYL